MTVCSKFERLIKTIEPTQREIRPRAGRKRWPGSRIGSLR
jgi:hypothetical protein